MAFTLQLCILALTITLAACSDDISKRPIGANCSTPEQCVTGTCQQGRCVDSVASFDDVLEVSLSPDRPRHPTGSDLALSCAWPAMPAGPTPAVTLSLDGEVLHQSFLNATGTIHHTLSAPTAGGDHEILCEVYPAGSLSPLTGRAVFRVNHPPTLGELTITPTNPTVTTSLAFIRPSIDDRDDDPARFAPADVVWISDDLRVTTTTVPTSVLRKGQRWVLHFSLSDGLDAVTQQSPEVVIANSAPVIDNVQIRPTVAHSGQDLTCDHPRPTDADRDTVMPHYAWFLDGSGAPSSASQTNTLPGSVVRAGQSWRCAVTPDDGEALGSTVSSIPVLVLNSTPSRPISAVLEPPEGTPETLFHCVYAAPTDPDRDNDPVRPVYDWLIDGTPLPGGGAQDTYRPVDFPRGTTITCCVALSDGGSSSAPICSEPVVLGNRPPDNGNTLVTPAEADETSTLTCVPSEFTDPDDDPLYYAVTWHVNGVSVPGAADGTLSGTAFDEGDTVTCALVASDGLLESARVPSKNEVRIGNTPPTVVAVRVVPSPVHASDLARCAVEVNDSDRNDTPRHDCIWFDGDDIVLGVGDMLAVSDRPIGSTVACACTANDESATSLSTMSEAAAVYNNAPSAPELRLEPAAPRPGDAVTCVVAASAVDPDGDPVSLAYSWAQDDTTVSGLDASTFPAGRLALCDELVCTATPDDGLLAGEGPPGRARALVTVPEICDGVDTDCDGETDEGLQCGHDVTIALSLPSGASNPRLLGPLAALVAEDRSTDLRVDVTLAGVPAGLHPLPIAWTGATGSERRACELLASGSAWLPTALPIVTSDGSPEAVAIHRFDDGSGCAPLMDVGPYTAPGVWTEGPFQLAFSGTTFDPIDHPCAVLVGGFHGWWSGQIVQRSADGDFRLDTRPWGGLPAGTWQFYLYGLEPDSCSEQFAVLTDDARTDLTVFPPWLIVPDDMSSVASAFFDLQDSGAGARLSVHGRGHVLPAGGGVAPGQPLPRSVLDARCVEGDVHACEAPESGSAMCLGGVWSRCAEQVTGRPEEVFGNGLDDDRDGFTDEGQHNLVANPGFEAGITSWLTNDSMPKADVPGADGIGNVTIRQSGSIVGARAVELNNVRPSTVPPAELWHLQAIGRVALEHGIPYVLTFRAWASQSMRFGVQIGDPAQEYRSVGLFIASAENPLLAGAHWSTYRVLFVAMRTVSDAELSFNAGLDSGTLLIDDVSLEPYAP